MTHRRICVCLALVLALAWPAAPAGAGWVRELAGEGHIAPAYDVSQSWKLEYHANISQYEPTSGRAFAYNRMHSELAWDFNVKWAALQNEYVLLAGERVKDTVALGGDTMFLVVWDSGEPGGNDDEVYPFAYTQAQVEKYFGQPGSWEHPAWEDHALDFLGDFRSSPHARNRWLVRSGDLRAAYALDTYPYPPSIGPGYYYDDPWYDPYYLVPVSYPVSDPGWWDQPPAPAPAAPDPGLDWYDPAPADPGPDDYADWDWDAGDDWGDWGDGQALDRRVLGQAAF